MILNKLLSKPLKERDADVQALLIVGLYQLYYLRTPDHAVLDQSVRATSDLNKKWAKGLVNAVLRNALRQREKIEQALVGELEYETAHPAWLAAEIREAWPEQASDIFAAGNGRPPMVLRVNPGRNSVSDYLKQLDSAGIPAYPLESSQTAVRMESPIPVAALPGFSDGLCSLQDEAAQWAADILAPQPGHRVLDACAAPGGKTCHLLEAVPEIDLTAIELDEQRCSAIEENLSRLALTANVLCADAAEPKSWWDNQPFDRILIDAPCSGTGVIRRHPDIKVLRRRSDIDSFVAQQTRLLDGLWPLLAGDGLLLYVTCSIMPLENEKQILAFLQQHADATIESFDQGVGLRREVGLQSLPREDGPDGFYFALLRKT